MLSATMTRTVRIAQPVSRRAPRVEEVYRLLVESVGDEALFVLDSAGHVVTWNSGARRLFGYTEREVLGLHFRAFMLAGSGHRGAEKRLANAIERGSLRYEGWLTRRDGTRFWAHAQINALVADSSGQNVFAVVVRDETKAKSERQISRQREARLQVIADSMRDYAMCRLDREGHVQSWTSGAERFYGYSKREIIDCDISILYTPEDLDRRRPGQSLEEASIAGQIIDHVWHVRRDGSRVWTESALSAVRDAEGTQTGFTLLVRDATEQRRKRSSQLCDSIMSTLLRAHDIEPMVGELCNMFVRGVADWCAIELLDGLRLRLAALAHVDPEKAPIARMLHERCAADHRVLPGARRVVSGGGVQVYEDYAKELLAALQVESLDVLEGLDPRGALVVPLMVREKMLGALTLVRTSGHEGYDEDDRDRVQMIGRVMAMMMENLALNGRGEQLPSPKPAPERRVLRIAKAPCDVDAIIRTVLCNHLITASQRGIQVVAVPTSIAHKLLCDRGRISEVLDRILRSAIESTPSGGSIWISTSEGATGLRFSVSATNLGAGQDVSSPALAQARRIIEEHGGRIWAEATIGAGTTFCFELPAA
jgi:PAS domain S-box-containing protein